MCLKLCVALMRNNAEASHSTLFCFTGKAPAARVFDSLGSIFSPPRCPVVIRERCLTKAMDQNADNVVLTVLVRCLIIRAPSRGPPLVLLNPGFLKVFVHSSVFGISKSPDLTTVGAYLDEQKVLGETKDDSGRVMSSSGCQSFKDSPEVKEFDFPVRADLSSTMAWSRPGI